MWLVGCLVLNNMDFVLLLIDIRTAMVYLVYLLASVRHFLPIFCQAVLAILKSLMISVHFKHANWLPLISPGRRLLHFPSSSYGTLTASHQITHLGACSNVFSTRKSDAASLILLNSMQNACTSINKSCTLMILLRMSDCKKTHTKRTKRFCMYLSLMFSQEEMQLEM